MLIKKCQKYLIITCFWSLTLQASLMMSSDEVDLLNGIAPVEEEANYLLEIPETSNFSFSTIEEILFLSAILYLSPIRWTVWINERTYTADNKEDSTLKITKVTSHYIEFELKNATKKTIRLRSNQSLITIGHHTVDGDARQKHQSIQL